MKLGSKIIMMLAYSFCYVWHKVRCRAFRRIDDFNYHVFAIDANPQLPFYKKIVEINNVFEKTVSVKREKISGRNRRSRRIREKLKD